ncbi:MAG: hypothetical protein AAF514_10405, partial [Verrucomicrobiota bacterium]
MEKAIWKIFYLKNTVSSLVFTVIRLVTGLLIFRLSNTYWDREEFGFWALLWSVFGFGVLLDFGMGLAVQKAVAQKSRTGDIEGINRLVASVFWGFLFVGLIIPTVAYFARSSIFPLIGLETAMEQGRFQRTYLIFFFGMGLTLPLAMFMEILNGLQRVYIVNWLKALFALLHLGGLYYAFQNQWKQSDIMFLTVSLPMVSCLICLAYARKHLQGFSLSPGLFRVSALKAQMSFSLVAYLITMSNVILMRTDQAVISVMLGLSAVTLYQWSFKMGEILNTFGRTLQQLVAPAAANLHEGGDSAGLRDLLMKSSRFMFLFLLPAYLVSACYLEPLILLLANQDSIPREVLIIGHCLLFAIFFSQVVANCGKRILVMSNHEHLLMKLSVAHALSNLILSVLLARYFGLVGVAVATLVTSVIFSGGIILPILLNFSRVGFPEYLAFNLRGTWKGILALAAAVIGITTLAPLPSSSSFLESLGSLGWRSLFMVLPYLAAVWP